MDERRYYGLDALRGSLMLLGIVLHSGMFYVAALPMPLPTDRNTSYLFDGLILFIHSFRMQAFFVLAGFFAALLVGKRGLRGAYQDRWRRVLVPLVASCVTILPATALLSANYLIASRFNVFSFVPDLNLLQLAIQERVAQGVPLDQPGLAHLWFLEYLCLFYLLLPICLRIAQRLRPWQPRIDSFLRSPFTIIVLGFVTALELLPFQGGQVHLETTLLIPHLPSLVLYGTLFVLGYLFYTTRAFLPSLAQKCGVWASLAGVLSPVAGYLYLLDMGASADLGTHLAAALANGLLTWSLIFLFIGTALRYFDRESPWIQYASQSAYWVYLIHLPAICLSALLLVHFDWPAYVKFCINVAFGSAVAFLTFHYGVQGSLIGEVLHGRRLHLEWPWCRKGANGSSQLLS